MNLTDEQRAKLDAKAGNALQEVAITSAAAVVVLGLTTLYYAARTLAADFWRAHAGRRAAS